MNTSETQSAGSLHPIVSRRSLREQIITAARLKNPDIGDDSMIASMEWGYWIGSIYVSKDDLAKSANRVLDDTKSAD